MNGARFGHYENWIDRRKSICKSHEICSQNLYIQEAYIISKTGAPKKKFLTPPQLSDEEETANAEIPQVAHFRPLVCRTPALCGLALSTAKRRTKTKKYQLGLKMERSRRPADLAITERALATRGCRRDFRNPFRDPPNALAGRLSRPPNDGT